MKLGLSFLIVVFSFMANAGPEEDLALEKKLSAEYLGQMALEPQAQVIDQGIVLRPIYVSDSQKYPTLDDQVQVSYYLVDRTGHVVDESITSDEVVTFPLAKLIKCWQLAIPKMSFGSYYKVSCPSDVAYGDHGAGDAIKPGAALTFRINLFGVTAVLP